MTPEKNALHSETTLRGQWMGNYSGQAPGFILVNIDDMGDHFRGTAFICPQSDPSALIPPSVALLKTKDRSSRFTFTKLPLGAMNPNTHQIESVLSVQALAPHAELPMAADVEGELINGNLKIKWKTDRGLEGHCELPTSRVSQPSDYKAREFTWKKFKALFSKIQGKGHIFRGQNMQARLCTKFHRSGRSDLSRFVTQDIPTLYKRLSARTRHVFKLNDPDETGAFYNLIQHHGYPTPLLDWTQSPFVAAFFAFRGISSSRARSAKRGEKVRIFIFDQKAWHEDFNPVWMVNGAYPHFTIAEFIAIENERMIPQQAVSSATNVVDIESYIRSREADGKTYLEVIDLPMRERDLVIRELSAMGITAGSLFPGLDGTCEELRERFFQF